MKKAIVLLSILLVVSIVSGTEAPLGTVDIVNGTVVTMDIGSVNYGGVAGKVMMRLGASSWTADAVWLLPADTTIGQFKYTGSSYSVPSSANMTNNCRSSVYSNETLGKRAFKATVQSDGSYCVLADPGTYQIVAEY